MRMGFTASDMRTMSLSRLVHMADAYAEANRPKDESNQPRAATQADIAAVFC